MTRNEQSRLEILEAAAEVIAAHGFHGMSMRDLARATGKGLSSLYNYFASKDELLFAIQSRAFTTLIESAEAGLEGVEGSANRLYVLIHNHVRYFHEHPAVMQVLVHEARSLPPEQRKEIRALKERYYALGQELVRQILVTGCDQPKADGRRAVATDELERVTYGMFGMLNWIYGWYEPERHGSPTEVARSIHRMALCGMVARCPQRMSPDSTLDARLDVLAPKALLQGRNAS